MLVKATWRVLDILVGEDCALDPWLAMLFFGVFAYLVYLGFRKHRQRSQPRFWLGVALIFVSGAIWWWYMLASAMCGG